MHSADEAPPLGEPIAAVYSRMASFYEGVCAPLAASGSNVLVVSHQYALEPLALYLAGEPPESYRNVNLPNGKALTPEDLAECMRAQHGGGWRQRMQHFGDACVLASAYVAPATTGTLGNTAPPGAAVGAVLCRSDWIIAFSA